MSVCDDSFKSRQELAEENRQLREQLAELERMRRAGSAFTAAEAGRGIILPGRQGRPLEISAEDANRGWQGLAATMESPDVDAALARGIGERAKPMGAEGRFTNFDQILSRVDITDTDTYLRLKEALGLQWEQLNPEDFAFVTKVNTSEAMAEKLARAFADRQLTTQGVLRAMANGAARFVELPEALARLRFFADRTKKGYLDQVRAISEFMEELPGAEVPPALKAEAFRLYRLALVAERDHSFALRKAGQTLQSAQNGLGDVRLDLSPDEGDLKDLAEAINLKPADVRSDSHIGRVIQAVDDGPAGQGALQGLLDAADVDIDPKGRLDADWENVHLRIGNALVKDSQLMNLNTQVKPGIFGNFIMGLYGPAQTMMKNGLMMYPVGTKLSRDDFMDWLKVHQESVSYSLDAIRSAGVGNILRDTFWEGKGHFGGNHDTYGRHLQSNAQELAELELVMNRPYDSGNKFAIFRDKLQAAARILALSLPADTEPGRWQTAMATLSGRSRDLKAPQSWRLPVKPALRALGTSDEIFGRFQYLFRLKASLETKARMEGAQLGLLTERDRAEWVQARIDEAIYQATPTEANIKAFRKKHGLKGSDATDDEIAAIIAEQNLAGGPTMATVESAEAFEYSAYTRMQNKPQGSGPSALGRPVERIDEAMMTARKSWFVDTLVPYWRAPFNSLLFDHRLSTFAAVDTAKLLWGFSKGNPPSREFVAQVQASWVMSGAVLALFAALNANGHISGSFDPDPRKRNRIGGVPYLGGMPVLNTLFLWKDLGDAWSRASSSSFDPDEMGAAIMQVLTGQLMRQTGLAQLQQLVEALSGARAPEQAARRFLGWMGAGQLPFIGVERNMERLVGADAASFFLDGKATPGQRFALGEDDPIGKVERALRELAYSTLPATAALTGAPRKTVDWLGSPIGHIHGVDIAKGFPFFPGAWPNDPVYAELDAQDQLNPPRPLMERTLNGVGMSDQLQAEYNEIYGSARGDSLIARSALAGRTVAMHFPLPVSIVLPGGERLVKGGSVQLPLGPLLERHVKGKTVLQAFRSLFNSPEYQAMEEDPTLSADPAVRDQPQARRRTRPAQVMIRAIKDYYDLLAQDELERRAANARKPPSPADPAGAIRSEAALQYSDARDEMIRQAQKESIDALTPGRGRSGLQSLIEAVNPAQ